MRTTDTTITEQEQHYYLNGGCAVLATAINNATGWQIIVNTDDDGNSGHAMIRRPDGMLIDITCEPFTDAELIDAWPSSTVMDVTDSDLADWGWDIGAWADTDAVADVARRVIALAGTA